jgi:hypothetical protein
MIGNYLSLRQPKVKELIEVLEKENSDEIRGLIEALSLRDLSDSVKWSLDRISYDLPIFHSVWDYVNNLRGARFEIQSSLNGIPENLDLRLLKNRELPSEFSLFGELLIPESLDELYELKKESKNKIIINKGARNWNYPLSGIIKKIDENKCFLEFQ